MSRHENSKFIIKSLAIVRVKLSDNHFEKDTP